MFSFYITV